MPSLIRRAVAPKPAMPKLLAIVGPTASGKTDLAVALAKKYKGEIISADSRQFYRGTDIGSDIIAGEWKRDFAYRGAVLKRRTYVARGVPHYLVGFLSPSRPFTVAQFKDHVIRIAADIAKRGHLPILAGGTGLYLKAVIDNYEIPGVAPNEAFRAEQEKRATDDLFAELATKDPAYAGRIPPNNRRYIIRALEVMAATGKTVTEAQAKGEPLFEVLQIGIKRPRAAAFERINLRVDRMMKQGLLEEARKLGRKYGWDAPAMSGLGHKQLGAYLRGETSLEAAVERIKSDTRSYAKRQETWFKRDARIVWVKTQAQAERAVGAFLGVVSREGYAGAAAKTKAARKSGLRGRP